jgi:hypothetical protein
MLGDGVGKEVWLIKSRADLVSDVKWVVLQDATKYAPFVASQFGDSPQAAPVRSLHAGYP